MSGRTHEGTAPGEWSQQASSPALPRGPRLALALGRRRGLSCDPTGLHPKQRKAWVSSWGLDESVGVPAAQGRETLALTPDQRLYLKEPLEPVSSRKHLFLKNLFIHLFWLHQVLFAALIIFDSCSMWTLSFGRWDLVLWPGVELSPPVTGPPGSPRVAIFKGRVVQFRICAVVCAELFSCVKICAIYCHFPLIYGIIYYLFPAAQLVGS